MTRTFLFLSLIGFNISCNLEDRSEKIIRDFLYNVYNGNYEEADQKVCEKRWNNPNEYLEVLQWILDITDFMKKEGKLKYLEIENDGIFTDYELSLGYGSSSNVEYYMRFTIPNRSGLIDCDIYTVYYVAINPDPAPMPEVE